MKISLFQSEDISVTLRKGTGPDAYSIISFTGIGNAFAGINYQNEEFNKFLGFGNQIWITDKKGLGETILISVI